MQTRWTSFEQPINVLIQGASKGIGLGMVEALLEDGLTSHVYATSRSPERSDALMRHAGSERLTVLSMDITDEAAIERVASRIAEEVGTLDLIVNTTGLLHDANMTPEKRLQDLNHAQLMRSFSINAVGTMMVIKHMHKLMPRRRRAVLASLSARVGSIGDNGLGGWYGYRASKAALNQGIKTASVELARRYRQAICVALHPGTVNTGLSEPFQGNVPDGKLFSVTQCVDYLFEVIDTLGAEDTGRFFDWAGEPIEW